MKTPDPLHWSRTLVGIQEALRGKPSEAAVRAVAAILLERHPELLERPWTPVAEGLPEEEVLTDDEHRAVHLSGELATLLAKIIGDGPAATGDLAEMVHEIHAVQNRVLAQAAARSYPGMYRLLGGKGESPVGGSGVACGARDPHSPRVCDLPAGHEGDHQCSWMPSPAPEPWGGDS